jgi:hypothetical protein
MKPGFLVVDRMAQTIGKVTKVTPGAAAGTIRSIEYTDNSGATLTIPANEISYSGGVPIVVHAGRLPTIVNR